MSTGLANWTQPTATDNGVLVRFDSDAAPGSSFELGSTEVTYTALDSVGLMSECRFNVTVEGKE